ncbi:DinB family protein [Mucilaginibacter sp.]
MSITKEHKRLDSIFDTYRAWIESIPNDQFDQTPPHGGWSYAEVYSHILQATMASTIALERCTHQSDKPNNGKANWIGKLVLLFARFPPGKIKQPSSVSEKMPALKISKEEARNLIIKCRKRIDEMVPLTSEKVAIRRVKHPRLGMFTAAQWFKFIRIHLAHHIKQLSRIKKDFTSS